VHWCRGDRNSIRTTTSSKDSLSRFYLIYITCGKVDCTEMRTQCIHLSINKKWIFRQKPRKGISSHKMDQAVYAKSSSLKISTREKKNPPIPWHWAETHRLRPLLLLLLLLTDTHPHLASTCSISAGSMTFGSAAYKLQSRAVILDVNSVSASMCLAQLSLGILAMSTKPSHAFTATRASYTDTQDTTTTTLLLRAVLLPLLRLLLITALTTMRHIIITHNCIH